jgi:murein DD-endopeptidase MepM/ murein hydrolase activator NlpD
MDSHFRSSVVRDDRRMTFIVVPSGAGDLSTRSFEISYRRLKAAAAVIALAVLLWVAMAVTFWYVAAQAARVPGLSRQVALLEDDRERVVQLAETLARVEDQYRQVRMMLGSDRASEADGLWLPPLDAGSQAAGREDSLHASVPTAWPLAERGFVTRGHLGAVGGDHPGLDIAIPEGSYVRASGNGTVVEVGEDRIYGKFIRIRHSGGYESMYAHASQLFVETDESVDRYQVIALSGNTGLSTAPHLHFEIRKDGDPVDPQTMLELDG